MSDLTPHIIGAAERSSNYSLARLVAELGEVVADQELKIDWDDEAGEDWAAVASPNTFLAIVWKRGPLAIGNAALPASVVTWLKQQGLDVIVVASFDEAIYRINETAVPLLKGPAPWPDVVPLEGMSIRDLWWATV